MRLWWAVLIAVGVGFIGAFVVNMLVIRRHVRRMLAAVQCGETLGDLVCARVRYHDGAHVAGDFVWQSGDRHAWSPRVHGEHL